MVVVVSFVFVLFVFLLKSSSTSVGLMVLFSGSKLRLSSFIEAVSSLTKWRLPPKILFIKK